jgi:transcriptional regulator with XRE-family HTH domain
MTLTKKIVISFGERLRLLREQKKLSLREVASGIGIDTSLLGKIERNERQATREQIKLIAKFFKYNEQLLIEENLSDQLAYKIIEANVDSNILKVAEQKIEYLKSTWNGKI